MEETIQILIAGGKFPWNPLHVLFFSRLFSRARRLISDIDQLAILYSDRDAPREPILNQTDRHFGYRIRFDRSSAMAMQMVQNEQRKETIDRWMNTTKRRRPITRPEQVAFKLHVKQQQWRRRTGKRSHEFIIQRKLYPTFAECGRQDPVLSTSSRNSSVSYTGRSGNDPLGHRIIVHRSFVRSIDRQTRSSLLCCCTEYANRGNMPKKCKLNAIFRTIEWSTDGIMIEGRTPNCSKNAPAKGEYLYIIKFACLHRLNLTSRSRDAFGGL